MSRNGRRKCPKIVADALGAHFTAGRERRIEKKDDRRRALRQTSRARLHLS
jgi:hypothetical protein